MSKKTKTVFVRLLRAVVAGAAGAAITVIPEVGDLFPADYKQWAAIGISAVILALDKLRRWGDDPSEVVGEGFPKPSK